MIEAGETKHFAKKKTAERKETLFKCQVYLSLAILIGDTVN